MLQSVPRRTFSLISAIGLVAASVFTLVATQSTSVSAARASAVKYGVCHRTNAIKNPYRFITVAWSSVDGNNNGHDAVAHDGPVFNIANPAASHGTTPRDSGLGAEAGGSNNRWGDIFEASRGNGNGANYNAVNWTTAGQAIFNGATFTYNGVTKPACRKMTVTEYISSEKEENPNKPMSEIMGELDDQGASEDEALKQSLGGSFTTWYTNNGGGSENPNLVNSLINAEAPKVTTETPTNLTGSTATLQGTISPSGASMVWYFQWGTDSTLTTFNETTLSSAVTTSQNVSTGITGLTSSSTYYYRTVGVVSNGQTGDALVETVLYGVIKQFTFGAPSAPTITSIVCGNASLTVNYTAGNTNYGSVTGYEYSVDGGAYVNSGVSGSASGSFTISSGLTNGVAVVVSIRAITASVKGLDSNAVEKAPCGAPVPTTDPASNVQNTTATINGTVNSNGAQTTVTFTWGTDSTLSTGTTTTAATQSPLAPTALLPVSLGLTGLTGGTTYYFKVNATNSGGGPISGSILSFVTPSVPLPSTTTTPATSVTTTTATINGTGTSNGAQSTIEFKWGTDATLTTGTTTTLAAQSPLSSSSSGAAVSLALTGLTPFTTYYFRTIITNTNGTETGIIRSFTTLQVPPSATTEPATSITDTTATINGTGTSNGAQSDITFTWGTSSTLSSGNTTTAAAQSPLSSSSNGAAVSLALTGLTGGTTYYFQVTITNTNGSATGIIRNFTTPVPTSVQNSTSTSTTLPASTSTTSPTTTTPPSTTTPTTSPVTPTSAVTPEVGRVIGVAWFDVNKNDKRDTNEPLLASLPIKLVPTGATAQSSGRVHAMAMAMTTGSDGLFDFTTVVPGKYQIVGDLPSGYGIERSWDSSGNDDWAVNVTVVASKVSRGDFAAIGNIAIQGCYSGTGEATKLNAAWDGFDRTLGTKDDVSFAAVINDDCSFDMQGLPVGDFAVKAATATGKVLTATTMKVTSQGGEVKSASLKATAVVRKVLPATGSSSSQMLLMALYAMGSGAAVVAVSRRRRRF